MHRSTYLIGYWQDERYFLDAGVRIAEELDPSTPMRTSVLEQAKLLESDTAFVHLRRTRFPYLLPVDYYTNAMGLMRDLYKVRRFIIFGDDPQWAHEHLARYGDVNIHEPGRTSDVEDLWLMSNFRFGIVANSSFSWWSAWKAKMREPTRPMICPDTWGFPTRPSASWIQLRAKLDYRVIPPLGTGLIGCRV